MSSIAKRRPGRPPSYIFDKPDEALTNLERRLKLSVTKRRARQNRSYHRRKAQPNADVHTPTSPLPTSPTPSLTISSSTDPLATVEDITPLQFPAVTNHLAHITSPLAGVFDHALPPLSTLIDARARAPASSVAAVRALSFFPATFDAAAAEAVLGDRAAHFAPLVDSGVVVEDGRRFRLRAGASAHGSDGLVEHLMAKLGGGEDGVRARFVAHFGRLLGTFGGDCIYRDGKVLRNAMRMFGEERCNIEHAVAQADPLGKLALLRTGAAVMRYMMDARTRIRMFEGALRVSDGEAGDGYSLRNRARVELALGEAHLDMLDIEAAEGPVKRAKELLGKAENAGNVVEADNLALLELVMAEICLVKGRFMEAKALLRHALRVVSNAGLSESTLMVNALRIVVGVHLATKKVKDAMWTSTKMMALVSGIDSGSFHSMPVHVDALKMSASVSLSLSQPEEAEKLFVEALEIVNMWLGKEGFMFGAPFHHNQYLNIWLLDGLACALRKQGKFDQAEKRAYEADKEGRKVGFCGKKVAEEPKEWMPMEGGDVFGCDLEVEFGPEDFGRTTECLNIDHVFLAGGSFQN